MQRVKKIREFQIDNYRKKDENSIVFRLTPSAMGTQSHLYVYFTQPIQFWKFESADRTVLPNAMQRQRFSVNTND